MKGHSHFVSDLDLSQDSRFCLSSSWDGTIRLWNLKTATTRTTLIGHEKDVLSVAFSPDNRQIASGSMDKNVKIWNLTEGRHLDEVDAECAVNVVLFASKLYWLVIGTENGIRVYDLPGRKFIDRYEVVREVDETKVVDPKKNKKNRKPPPPVGCTSLVWSKNQQHLYAGFTDHIIRVLGIVNSDL